jgi:hypothetical protein
MSKTQEAKDLLVLALNVESPAKDRLAALLAANELRKELSIGWGKLGSPEGFNMGATLEELREQAAQKEAEGDQEKPLDGEPTPPEGQTDGTGMSSSEVPEGVIQPQADVPKTDRGGIGRLVNLLLTTTDADYASIVASVKEKFPEAKTTARSVASVAADLRRDGVDVKTRRKAAAPKADAEPTPAA